MYFRCCFIVLLALFLTPFTAPAFATDKPDHDGGSVVQDLEAGAPELDVMWVDEKNGNYIPLEAVFNDEEGGAVTLGSVIDRPTLILPVYFHCPSSCSLNLVNLTTALKRSNLNPGKDFKIIAFSFNEKEDSENARIAKRNYLRLLPDNFPKENWKFLTGGKASIDSVTQAIGYTFKPLEDGTFIHPSALLAVAEDGMIIKYVYGNFVSGDVDMAISEAQKGTPGLSVKRFLDYCFNYDPEKSRSFFQSIKLGALLVFAVMGFLFFLYVRKVGKNKTGSFKGH